MKKAIVSAALLGTVLTATAAETPKVILEGQCVASHVVYAIAFSKVPGFADSTNASIKTAREIATANKDNKEFEQAVVEAENALKEKATKSTPKEFITALAAFNTAACQATQHAGIALPTQEQITKAFEEAKKQAATQPTGKKS